jgi:hypothetical protein
VHARNQALLCNENRKLFLQTQHQVITNLVLSPTVPQPASGIDAGLQQGACDILKAVATPLAEKAAQGAVEGLSEGLVK